VLRVGAAMLAVFLVAAAAQRMLHDSADRIRRTELALTRIQSRASAESLLHKRIIDSGRVGSGGRRQLDRLDRQIRASLAYLPATGMEDIHISVNSYQAALAESIDIIARGHRDEAEIHDAEKVDAWFGELGASVDEGLVQQRRIATRTQRLYEAGSLLTLLLACVMVGFLLWRFERARGAAMSARQAAIAESEARFRALVQNSSDVITVLERDGTIRYQSPSALTLFSTDPSELVGTPVAALAERVVHPDDAAAARDFIDGALSGADDGAIEFRMRLADGAWRYVESTLTNSLDDPYVRGVVLNTRDVTQRKTLEERLRHQAFHDSLTHLPNRALLLDRMKIALARRAHEERSLAVVLLDLDGFKGVNDSLGHAAGDELLIQVAERLAECVRAADSVARLGGDEFAFLLEEMHGPDAEYVADRILAALSMPFIIDGKEIFIRASIGIVVSSAGERSPEELLRDADVAMYAAKGEGKNRFATFEPGMRIAVVDRMHLEADLRGAIERDELVLYYQPTVELATGRIAGIEALARWAHPERGLVPPEQFIPLAEDSGLIVPVGRWVLDEACRQTAQWQRRFGVHRGLAIGVNLSGRQLHEPGLVDDIEAIVSRHGLAPNSLILEITESVLMAQTEEVYSTLAGLQALGLRLAIDDFGTGYSSLSYLQSFPIEILKIDRSFVARVAAGPEDSAVARAIVKLAQTLKLDIVAEGIERQDQLDRLLELGCGNGQGYLFSTPVPASELEELLARPGRDAAPVLASAGRSHR
jgi:diguanylate cyclase (GGDEF)-like protein/PAS domain S-box-containing protein